MLRLPKYPLLALACCAAHPAWAADRPEAAQEIPQIRVVPAENVKIDYAQVLRVEPVYQTLRATRTEERCDPEPAPQAGQARQEAREEGLWSRMVESVRSVFGGSGAAEPEPAPPSPPPQTRQNCRIVQVDREFQRPIAYDVDYVYKGTKYRSRLAEDPGNRLRVRVSVTPYVPEAQARPQQANP
ncbi:MAG: hypothetical protein C0P65_008655 [Lysobacteraceae bacterium]|jgi:hypothetical protein